MTEQPDVVDRREDRLQEAVYRTVFPRLARGLLAKRQPSDEELAELFEATVTLLYRLLFVLYAEGRDLLPIGEPGYDAISLQRMRQEIGATIDADAASESATSLYDRLTELFRAVSAGDAHLGVPAYSGELFQFAPDNCGDLLKRSRAARAARFLQEHKVPDRELALAIDGLSRERDDATGGMTFIDYKSLPVRRLGSIYEGLLEFKLEVADGNPASRNGDTASPKLCLKSTSGRRKATGSYYTPDAIIEYLIHNTVGPVLDAKFADLRPAFQSAAEKRDEPPLDFIERLFDIKILDPATGTGHFLVEAVNFIAGRLSEFLSEFPDNPVRRELDRTRQCIIDERTQQGRAILPRRLTDEALLKQRVLEHCLYGIDIDPLAVELTKASLWLETFTPGAPLPSLDRHLQCGDALVEGTDGHLPDASNVSEAAGFDCVVGNPPYVRIQNLDKTFVQYLTEHYKSAVGKFDLYVPFVERGASLLRPNGCLGMIVPNKFLTAHYGTELRGLIAGGQHLRQIVDFEFEPVFPGVSTYCCLLFLGREPCETVTVARGQLQRPVAKDWTTLPADHFGQSPWSLRVPSFPASVGGIPLEAACSAIFQGLITGADRLFVGKCDGQTIRLGDECVDFDPGIFRPLLKGPDVRRLALHFSNHYVLYPYKLVDGRTKLMTEEEIATRFPQAYAYLRRNKTKLQNRGRGAMVYPAWYAHWCPRTIERFAAPKIVTQVMATRASFALDLEGSYAFVGGGNAGVYGIIPHVADEDRLWLLAGILNSRQFDAQVQARSSRFRGGYFSYARRFIEEAIIPQLEELDCSSELAKRVVAFAKEGAEGSLERNARHQVEIDAAVDELYRLHC